MTHEHTAADLEYIQRRLEQDQKMSAPTRGFWVVAGPMGLCDQALSMELQRARFYPEILQENLRLALPNLNRKGAGREKPFETVFDEAFGALANDKPDSLPELAAKLEKLVSERLAGVSLRDCAGCSFLYHEDRAQTHWGALTLAWDEALLVPEDVESFCDASEASRDVGMRAAARAADLVLDRFEFHFGLNPSELRHAVDGMHAFWGADNAPSCVLETSNQAALALLEKTMLGEQAPAPSASAKKPGL